jgi:hypothetical protein
MKDYKNFVNEDINRKNIYKNREELDSMSKEEVSKLRTDILSDREYRKNSVPEEYINELAFYTMVRFKEDEFAMYQRWKDSEDSNVGFVRAMTLDGIYKMSLSNNLPENNKFKHITPMIYPDNIDMDDIYKFNDAFKK